MSEKTEYDELLKIGLRYDIRLKNDSEFHDCQLLVKDLDCRMIKIRHYLDVADGKLRIFRDEMINMDQIFKVTFPKRSRFFWTCSEEPAINVVLLHDLRLTDEDVAHNKDIKFYDSIDDAVKAIVIEKMAKSENPKNWTLKFYGSNCCIAKHTGISLKDGGWEGTRGHIVYEMLSELNKE